MTPAAIPPLVSLILNAILAIIAWSNRRGRITSAFALFASSLALMSLAKGAPQPRGAIMRRWARRRAS